MSVASMMEEKIIGVFVFEYQNAKKTAKTLPGVF